MDNADVLVEIEAPDNRDRPKRIVPYRFPVLWFAALLALCYAVVLGRLADQWLNNDTMSHGVFVPVLVAYIVWQRREIVAATPASPSLWGLLLMVIGAVMLCIGPPSLTTFSIVTRLAFLLSLVGLLLYLRGYPALRRLVYPLCLLLFMIPLPGYIYERLTLPLQTMASVLSERVLELLGYSVLREGHVLRLPVHSLEVAEACSGLRSLFALSFLGQGYIYLFDRRPWMRGVVALAMVPIAVFANVGRITVTGVLSQGDPQWLSGSLHEAVGQVVFVFAFVGLLIFHWVFNRIWRFTHAEAA